MLSSWKVPLKLTNDAASSIIELKIVKGDNFEIITCNFPSLKRLHLGGRCSESMWKFAKCFESSFHQLESFVFVSNYIQNKPNYDYLQMISQLTSLKEIKIKSQHGYIFPYIQYELNLPSPHLKRATIKILGSSLEIKTTSNKLEYINIGASNVKNISDLLINARYIVKSGVLFDRCNSTCICSGSYRDFSDALGFFSQKCFPIANIVIWYSKLEDPFFQMIECLKPLKKFKILHCSVSQENLNKILKFPLVTELLVTSYSESQKLRDDLHQNLLKMINNRTLVKYYLPWTCLCTSNCPLRTIKPKIG